MTVHFHPVAAEILPFPAARPDEQLAIAGQMANLYARLADLRGTEDAMAIFASAATAVLANLARRENRVVAMRFALACAYDHAVACQFDGGDGDESNGHQGGAA